MIFNWISTQKNLITNYPHFIISNQIPQRKQPINNSLPASVQPNANFGGNPSFPKKTLSNIPNRILPNPSFQNRTAFRKAGEHKTKWETILCPKCDGEGDWIKANLLQLMTAFEGGIPRPDNLANGTINVITETRTHPRTQMKTIENWCIREKG